MSPTSAEEDPPLDWDHLRPVIDETLQQLKEPDRETLLLRYFENLSFAEIAARQNAKEDAVRMRHNRALERLRQCLASKGVRSTEAALATLLAAEAVAESPLPAALAQAVTQAGWSSGQTVGASLRLLQLMSAKKALILTAVLAGLAGALGTAYPAYRRMAATTATDHQLQIDNDRLRDQLTAARLSAAQTASTTTTGQQSSSTTATAQGRLNQIHSAVTLREASRDAAPATIAHPLKFRGYDSPMNAVETFCLALYNSDAQLIARSLYLDPDAVAATNKIRATLSPELQAQYPTAQDLVAMCLAYDVIRHPGINNEDAFIGAPEPTFPDPSDFKVVNGWQFHLTSDGWKWNMPAQAIPVFVNNVLHPKPGAPQ